MPNNYFQFKQFTVHQERCALKVCTDACLFGGYVAEKIQNTNDNNQITKSKNQNANDKIQSILDIGTGTGLLSLMLAQKTDAAIDAVEIDNNSFLQAKENFANSPWKERLTIFNEDILLFNPGKKYDCIISNPPFFEQDLKSEDKSKNAAKHDTTLTLEQLAECAGKLLKDDGLFAVLLPYHRVEYFIAAAAKFNLHVFKQVLVKQTPAHNFFRGILMLTKNKKQFTNKQVSIKDETGNYSAAFTELLKDYYLYL